MSLEGTHYVFVPSISPPSLIYQFRIYILVSGTVYFDGNLRQVTAHAQEGSPKKMCQYSVNCQDLPALMKLH